MSRTYQFERKCFCLVIEINADLVVCWARAPYVTDPVFHAACAIRDLRCVTKSSTAELWLCSAHITLTHPEFDAVSQAVTDLTGKPITPADEVLA